MGYSCHGNVGPHRAVEAPLVEPERAGTGLPAPTDEAHEPAAPRPTGERTDVSPTDPIPVPGGEALIIVVRSFGPAATTAPTSPLPFGSFRACQTPLSRTYTSPYCPNTARPSVPQPLIPSQLVGFTPGSSAQWRMAPVFGSSAETSTWKVKEVVEGSSWNCQVCEFETCCEVRRVSYVEVRLVAGGERGGARQFQHAHVADIAGGCARKKTLIPPLSLVTPSAVPIARAAPLWMLTSVVKTWEGPFQELLLERSPTLTPCSPNISTPGEREAPVAAPHSKVPALASARQVSCSAAAGTGIDPADGRSRTWSEQALMPKRSPAARRSPKTVLPPIPPPPPIGERRVSSVSLGSGVTSGAAHARRSSTDEGGADDTTRSSDRWTSIGAPESWIGLTATYTKMTRHMNLGGPSMAGKPSGASLSLTLEHPVAH